MSTRSKLDPVAKQRKAARVALLRNPPKVQPRNVYQARALLAERALIHKSSRLNGNMKHELFMRGANQLWGLR